MKLMMNSVAVAILLFAMVSASHAQDTSRAPRFEARALVTVSDADMLPSAYLTGELGPFVGSDTLNMIAMDGSPEIYQAVSIPASNSVTGPPSSVAVSPDGELAVVIETLGARESEETTLMSELPEGRRITLIDISNVKLPTALQTLDGPDHPLAVGFTPSGSHVVVTYHVGSTDSPTVGVFEITDGKLGRFTRPEIIGWPDGKDALDLAFHPTEDLIALLNVDDSSFSIYKYEITGAGLRLTQHGHSIDTDKAPFLVNFTPDGRHVLVNASYAAWGFNFEPNSAPRGSVLSYRLNAGEDSEGKPQHRLVSRAVTGVVPEGLSISPDGEYVITANLERSTPPEGREDMARYGSMTLLELNPETGVLKRIKDFAFDGALPEIAVFDNSSRFVAVTVYSQFDAPEQSGSIDIWRVETDPYDVERTELVKTRHSIPVTRGPHSMVVLR